MTELFGGNEAIKLHELYLKNLENLDDNTINDSLVKNQERKLYITPKPLKPKFNDNNPEETNEFLLSSSDEYSSDISQNDTNNVTNDNIINENDGNSDDTNDKKDDIKQKSNDIEYIDIRDKTIFTYKPKFRKYRRKHEMAVLKKKQNESPFLNSLELKQRFSITKSKTANTVINDRNKISKLAKKNMLFLKELLSNKLNNELNDYEIQSGLNKTEIFDKNGFNRRLRLSFKIPHKRHVTNYKKLQIINKQKQELFNRKKALYLERKLRVPNKLDLKTKIAKYGRKKIWGLSSKKNKKGAKFGYEIPKNEVF